MIDNVNINQLSPKATTPPGFGLDNLMFDFNKFAIDDTKDTLFDSIWNKSSQSSTLTKSSYVKNKSKSMSEMNLNLNIKKSLQTSIHNPQSHSKDNVKASHGVNNNSNVQAQLSKINHFNEYTIRLLLSDKEAGVIFKPEVNVLYNLSKNKVKVSITKPSIIPNINDRILTLQGTVENVAKSVSTLSRIWTQNEETSTIYIKSGINSRKLTEEHTFVRLLVCDLMIGSILGTKGSNVKQIESISGIKLIAFKGKLPECNDRMIELQGSVTSIYISMLIIGDKLYNCKILNGVVINYDPNNTVSGIVKDVLDKREPLHPYPGKRIGQVNQDTISPLHIRSSNESLKSSSLHYRSRSHPNMRKDPQVDNLMKREIIVHSDILYILQEKSKRDLDLLNSEEDSLLNISITQENFGYTKITIVGNQNSCLRAFNIYDFYIKVIRKDVKFI
ncbi:hypothetical protein K502DRAFT_326686 [Neoconidiobolus thromboides FSU 785]|nr:hypothetical protein K502DRAFT_326686 [Neoconidiobolus thromboides FSU 785]